MGTAITMVVGSCYTHVAVITSRLVQLLRANGCAEERAQLLAVGTAELVNNIIEHAFAEEDGHDIIVEARVCDGELALRVTDHGRPVPADLIERIRAPRVDPACPAELPEGGMGLYIARQLFETLSWRNQGPCNVLLATAAC
jgi:serine/threonine-protein kinase RsbW